jgi:hypothetical protein
MSFNVEGVLFRGSEDNAVSFFLRIGTCDSPPIDAGRKRPGVGNLF